MEGIEVLPQSQTETSVVSLSSSYEYENDPYRHRHGSPQHAVELVNLQDSILDLTEDHEDDDDEDVHAVLMTTSNLQLFDQSMTAANVSSSSEGSTSPRRCEDNDSDRAACFQSPIAAPKPCFHTAPLTPPSSDVTVQHENSLLDRFTESFVESLCFGGDKDLAKQHSHNAWKGAVHMVQSDMLELLGCLAPVNENEMEQVWAWNQSVLERQQQKSSLQMPTSPEPPRGPQRHSLRARALRLHRLRAERTLQQPHQQQVSPTSVVPQHRSRSMDDRMLRLRQQQSHLARRIGFGMDPILPANTSDEEALGYDSDPEDVNTSDFSFETARDDRPPCLLPSPMMVSSLETIDTATDPFMPKLEDEDLPGVVQECLNMTFFFTWHPKDGTRPVPVKGHVERGTLVHGSIMLEPRLMWSEAYQPGLLGRKQLNSSCQKPFSVRLLNICRILEATPRDLDRSFYPLARPSHSFVIRTTEDDEEFVFEASSPAARAEVIRRLKLTVARFATLAVVEDYTSIYDEFYSLPTLP